MIGQTIGHYKIIAKLGAGGMGEVYLAEHTKLDRKDALKFLPHYLTDDPEFRSRLEHEAKATAALKHPNIVTVYDLGEHEGRLFIAMEYVEGESLEELIKRGDVSLQRAVEIAQQVCEGLQEVHEAGIVHRDIKPSNILIDSKGRARILDFGLAKSRKAKTQTATGTTLGTLQYESPEQVSGQPVDARSDLFSLGAVLYELITGRTPFAGEFEDAVRYSILNDDPEPLARYKSGELGELQRIVGRALTKDPSLRYQSAADLLAELRGVAPVTGPGPVAGPVRISSRLTMWWTVAAALVIVTALAITQLWRGQDSGGPVDRIMLAVLPFENLGSPDDEYFADGITEEITSRLAVVSGLGVISRTSAMQYKNTEKRLPQVAKELGVDYVLEGTIRWDKTGDTDRVRVVPQLIKVSDDTHLWADRMDVYISDIFGVQSQMAERVVEALNVTLLEPERQTLSQYPTENPEAYDYYLQARRYTGSSGPSLRRAEELYGKAVSVDPQFALAYAQLGRAHLTGYWYYVDHSETRLASARTAIDKALELDPELAAAVRIKGQYYYWGHRDYDRALDQLDQALKLQPSDAQSFAIRGYIKRRQGKWQSSMKDLERAQQLDPRTAGVLRAGGESLWRMRKWQQWLDYSERLQALQSGDVWIMHRRVLHHVIIDNDLLGAQRLLQEARGKYNTKSLNITAVWLDMVARDFSEALNWSFDPSVIQQVFFIKAVRISDSSYYHILRGDLYRYQGQNDIAAAHFDSARVLLEHWVDSIPDDGVMRSMLGRAYAGVNRCDDAIREGVHATELFPLDHDAMRGADVIQNLAAIYIFCNEYELALDQLEFLMSIPSDISVGYLRAWPLYDPLRDHPRFQALIELGDKVF